MRATIGMMTLALVCGWLTAKDNPIQTPPLSDAEFIKMVASDGMHEVELGKLATARAMNADVKKFGQQMVTDHTKANEELLTIARDLKVEVPARMMEKHQKMVDEFKDAQGAQFDTAYMNHMVKDHQQAVALFRQMGKDAKDARLKQFAEKTLPVLEQHHDMAKKIRDQLQKQ